MKCGKNSQKPGRRWTIDVEVSALKNFFAATDIHIKLSSARKSYNGYLQGILTRTGNVIFDKRGP